jgi:DNA-binding response OmpR family regulator
MEGTGLNLGFTVLLASPSPELHTYIENATAGKGIAVVHETRLSDAIARAAEEGTPVVVTDAELDGGDWRDVVTGFDSQAIRPSVIVLLRAFEPQAWAEALNLGAFDALPAAPEQDGLLAAITAAYQRWHSLELQAAARRANPHSVAEPAR